MRPTHQGPGALLDRLLPQGLATVIPDPLAAPERLRQWITLARALMGRPPLLLLDEVTSGLPPPVRERVIHHIRATGAACLAITHNLKWSPLSRSLSDLISNMQILVAFLKPPEIFTY